MFYTDKINHAIRFSIKTHEVYQKQKRKGKDIPYITHPLTVGLILARAGASEDTIVAGILHDTIEDSVPEKKVTREMLAERFGEKVADIVSSVSEPNKELSWEERKAQALEAIKTFSDESLLIKSADITSNVRELIEDYEQEGDTTFARFNAPKEEILLHYLKSISAILEKWSRNPLADDLKDIEFKISILLSGSVPRSGPYRFKAPTQCILWEKPELIDEPIKGLFELLETFVDESHLWRYLLKCRECGQPYFYEFYEEIDWEGGNDPQYVTYIPVETKEEIEMLKKSSLMGLLQFLPRLQKDHPKDAEKTTHWVEKE